MHSLDYKDWLEFYIYGLSVTLRMCGSSANRFVYERAPHHWTSFVAPVPTVIPKGAFIRGTIICGIFQADWIFSSGRLGLVRCNGRHG